MSEDESALASATSNLQVIFLFNTFEYFFFGSALNISLSARKPCTLKTFPRPDARPDNTKREKNEKNLGRARTRTIVPKVIKIYF